MAFHTVGSLGGKVGVNSLNIPGTSSRLSGVSVAMVAVGGILLWSGIKGATISDTLKGVFAGNPGDVQDTETIDFSSDSSGPASDASSGSGSQNYLTIAKYLVSNGYSNAAAAGIVGCVAGESSGNAEAKGAGSYGIIQEQGQQYASLVTGDPSKDLDAQLSALIAYDNAQGGQYISMLNQIADPVQAADFYSQYFERPAVKDSDVRASVAQSIYNELTDNAAPGVATNQTQAQKTANELAN